jgi:hypothetical protein
MIVVADGASGELGTEADGGVGVIEEEGIGATASIDCFTTIYFDEFDGFWICAGYAGPKEGCFAISHCRHQNSETWIIGKL